LVSITLLHSFIYLFLFFLLQHYSIFNLQYRITNLFCKIKISHFVNDGGVAWNTMPTAYMIKMLTTTKNRCSSHNQWLQESTNKRIEYRQDQSQSCVVIQSLSFHVAAMLSPVISFSYATRHHTRELHDYHQASGMICWK
jgi:hypothetical protein